MIAKLRKRQVIIWIPIAIGLIFIMMYNRGSISEVLNDRLPGISGSTETLTLIDEASVRWEREELDAQIYRDTDGSLVLSIESEAYINKPDLLVYLNRIGGSSIQNESLLIGSFAQNSSQLFSIPDSSLTNGSSFVLYSLPKKEIVDVAHVQGLGGNE